jgi:hypothetical protein
MGLGFVLVLWLVAGSVLAAIGGAILGWVTSLLTRGIGAPREPAIRAAHLLPLACLIWAGLVFVAQAGVNAGLLHRDIGTGDSWYAPLPNGYQVVLVDVTDQGTVRPEGSYGGIQGVRRLQVSGPYLFGGVDSHSFEHFGSNTDAIDSYFMLDTRTGKQTTESDLRTLTSEASKLGVSLHLEPIYTVYSRYRFTWFDVLVGCMLLLPPIAALIALGVWIMRLRRNLRLTATAT